MTDLLIRDVPDDVLAAIDARAKRLGISRSEYVRRQLAQAAAGSAEVVDPEDLRRFADTFADLGDAEVMAQAWRRTAG
jgi:plasmid stability protein